MNKAEEPSKPRDPQHHPFSRLTPDFIMDAVESLGYQCDCRIYALNSYENRVYQVGIEDAEPLIAKFYRPERWSNEQIEEEHQFGFELLEHELPIVAPIADESGKSLFTYEGFRFALYLRRGGHAPEFDNLENLLIMGRLLGRMHAIGSRVPFQYRPRLDIETFGTASIELVADGFIPPEYKANYLALTTDLLQGVQSAMSNSSRYIRTHGDCHAGNILWRNDIPNMVDLDDARMAPAVQDIWMMLSGDRNRQLAQLAEVVDGYNEFFDFDPRELLMIEALRSLRIVHHTAWLANRSDDPAFSVAFPWFNSARYWGEHILELREQIAALNEPPLAVF